MKQCKQLIVSCLAMAIALAMGAGQCLAESQDTAQSPPVNGTSSSGNYRDLENVPKLRSTTNAQRMDAARRAAERRAVELRDAAEKASSAPKLVSPQEMNGGAK